MCRHIHVPTGVRDCGGIPAAATESKNLGGSDEVEFVAIKVGSCTVNRPQSFPKPLTHLTHRHTRQLKTRHYHTEGVDD